jgi:hypothetical protein
MNDSTLSNAQERSNIERSWVKQLYRDYEQICYLYRLKFKPILIDLNHSKNLLGSWDRQLRIITISTYLIENYDWNMVLEILKHEVAHQIVSEKHVSEPEKSHGTHFKTACQQIAVESWARTAAVDLEGKIFHWKGEEPSDQQANLRRKAAKLLALATSQNEHEALVAMNMVQSLYAKHHLSDCESQAPDDFVTLTINHKKKRVEAYQTKICSILTSHFFVQIVFSSEFDQQKLCSHKTVEVMGRRENVLMAEYVYWFLNNNLHHLWAQFKTNTIAVVQGISARNSYFMGVLSGFDEKLNASDKEEVQQEQPSTKDQLITLSNAQVTEYVHQRHPKLSTRSWGTQTKDPNSYFAGKSAGSQLTLKKGLHQKAKNPIQLAIR